MEIIVPPVLYKYCSRYIFDEYISKGIFRLGTSRQYIEEFENGSGFADDKECVDTRVVYTQENYSNDFALQNAFKQRNLQISGLENHIFSGQDSKIINNQRKTVLQFRDIYDVWIFSTALSYSIEDHKFWHERQDCNYDLCVALNGEQFIASILNHLQAAGEAFGIRCGVVTYDKIETPLVIADREDEDVAQIKRVVFSKPSRFVTEREYRLAVFPCVDHPTFDPRNIQLENIDNIILDTYSL